MSPTILVVEDDPGVATMVGIILAEAGYSTVMCDNGSDALATFTAQTPDLVLLDGGQGQLSATLKVLDDLGISDLNIAAIAKGPDT